MHLASHSTQIKSSFRETPQCSFVIVVVLLANYLLPVLVILERTEDLSHYNVHHPFQQSGMIIDTESHQI